MTPNELPLVTLITPTDDRASLVEATIESVRAQTYPQVEHVILDDSSADDSKGYAQTINRGVAIAKGEIVSIMAPGDCLSPDAITTLVDLLREHADVLVAYPDWDTVGETGDVIEQRRTPDYSYVDMVQWHDCLPGPGALIRRSLVDAIDGWDPSFRYVADFDFYLRAGLIGPFRRIPLALATRWHHYQAPPDDQQGEAAARERIRLVEKLYARNDLPCELQAVRTEAFRNACFVAGTVVGSGHDLRDARFQIDDDLPSLHRDSARRALSTHRPLQEVIEAVQRAPADRLQAHEQLRESVDQVGKTTEWLHAQIAERDKATSWLRGVTTEKEKEIEWLHRELAERDRVIGILCRDLINRERSIAVDITEAVRYDP